MQTKQKDILNTQLSAGDNRNSTSSKEENKENKNLFKVKRIITTPFHVLEKEGQYFLTLGNHLLSVGMNSEEEVMKFMETNKWNIITSLVLLLMDQEHSKRAIERPKDITAIA